MQEEKESAVEDIKMEYEEKLEREMYVFDTSTV